MGFDEELWGTRSSLSADVGFCVAAQPDDTADSPGNADDEVKQFLVQFYPGRLDPPDLALSPPALM